jgi:DNA mismatch repair protein MutS
MTPMQRQYNEIKAEYPEDIVLFRLGDFYETFYADAYTVANVLGITLTGRGKGDSRIPMAGIPYHALPNYLPKLLAQGLKVVLVEQLTEPKPGQLVERAVTKVYTPGTLTEIDNLNEDKPNYLLAVYPQINQYGVSILDVSTGELALWETSNVDVVTSEIERLHPAEILWPTGSNFNLGFNITTPITYYPFNIAAAEAFLLQKLNVKTLKGFGVNEFKLAQVAAASAWEYSVECQKVALNHIKTLKQYPVGELMPLDLQTIRNLELIYSQWGEERATIFWHLNQCRTPMGKRLLRNWLLQPLLNAEKLQARWNAIAVLKDAVLANDQLREYLSQISDISRLTARVATQAANARELWALLGGISQTVNLLDTLKSADLDQPLADITQRIQISLELEQAVLKIAEALNPEPPVTLTEGGLIAAGYNAEVDELRELRSGNKELINQIQLREVQRTGIASLKVSFNNVFGYYIEVTRSNLDKVPTDYIRKQTLANAERFITPELKELEDKVLNAESRLYQLEYELFIELRNQLAEFSAEILQVAEAVAELDVFANFAWIAREYNYCKPELVAEDCLQIVAGRHPIVEVRQGEFVPNDLGFNAEKKLIVLTGPNMSGKSTYIRQTALIALLAQIGSFVPASEFRFKLLDRIFTRVGAADNLAKGESTFMVEMQETANILHNATARSLIILDEVGRGTSTYDGVAIAWAIAVDLLTRVQAKTLFATHYHELTALTDKYPGAENYHVAVVETAGQIVFTHRIQVGGTSKSYGLHVAEMAGVPKNVIAQAQAILDSFEGNTSNKVDNHQSPRPHKPRQLHPEQLTLDL